jgi:hypothetical protein
MLSDFRKEILPKAERKLTERVVSKAVSIFDAKIHIKNEKDIKFWDCFWEVAWAAHDERRKGLNSYYDVEVSVFLYPIKTFTLGIIYTTETDFREYFFKQDFVEDYAYWNNTDPDVNVSKKEWEQRAKDWGSLGHEPPDEIGFVRKIVPNDLMPMIGHEKWKEFYPTKKERASNVARDILFQEWLNENNITLDENNIFGTLSKFNKWRADTEEGQKQTAKKYKGIVSKITDIK